MPATEFTSSSRAASVALNTDYEIANTNAHPGSFYVLVIDASRMVAGEQLVVTEKVSFTGSQFLDRVVTQTFTYPMADGPHIHMPPLLAPIYFGATLNQLNGTSRLIPYTIWYF